MIQKTNCIVLSYTKYGDNSLIIKALTETVGVLSFIIKNVHSTKSKSKSNFFQPLTQLEVVYYKKDNQQIATIKEVDYARLHLSIPFNMVKSSIAFLIAEVLNKSIKEQEKNYPLYSYITNSINWLDEASNVNLIKNFSLIFLIHLTKFLGFFPRNLQDQNHLYFCIDEGCFLPTLDLSLKCLNIEESKLFSTILSIQDFNQQIIQIKSKESRERLIQIILNYYNQHLGYTTKIYSSAILQAID